MLGHRIQRFLQIIASEAGHYLACHHRLHFRGFGVTPFGYDLQSQIAIGHDTDQFFGLVLNNRYRTDVLALHQFCRFYHHVIWQAANRVFRHHIITFLHEVLLSWDGISTFLAVCMKRRLSGRPSFFQWSADLDDPQQFQNNEDDHDDEQYVDGIARARKAREDIRAEISEQP
jgi:hypothetical protein